MNFPIVNLCGFCNSDDDPNPPPPQILLHGPYHQEGDLYFNMSSSPNHSFKFWKNGWSLPPHVSKRRKVLLKIMTVFRVTNTFPFTTQVVLHSLAFSSFPFSCIGSHDLTFCTIYSNLAPAFSFVPVPLPFPSTSLKRPWGLLSSSGPQTQWCSRW